MPATRCACMLVSQNLANDNAQELEKDTGSSAKSRQRTTICCCAGEFSVYCDIHAFPGSNCACPTLNYVNKGEGNFLACYDPSKSSCNTGSPQWTPSTVDFGYNALIESPGPSNVGACWYTSMSVFALHIAFSDWFTFSTPPAFGCSCAEGCSIVMQLQAVLFSKAAHCNSGHGQRCGKCSLQLQHRFRGQYLCCCNILMSCRQQHSQHFWDRTECKSPVSSSCKQRDCCSSPSSSYSCSYPCSYSCSCSSTITRTVCS